MTDFETIADLLRDEVIRTYSRRIGREAAEDCYQETLAYLLSQPELAHNPERAIRSVMKGRVANWKRDQGLQERTLTEYAQGVSTRPYRQDWEPAPAGPPGSVIVYDAEGRELSETSAVEWKRRQLLNEGGGK